MGRGSVALLENNIGPRLLLATRLTKLAEGGDIR